MQVVGTPMAVASRIRGKAVFFEEGGVYLALLSECTFGAALGRIVDSAHLRDKPHYLPQERPFPVG